jgi:hypothetical protein
MITTWTDFSGYWIIVNNKIVFVPYGVPLWVLVLGGYFDRPEVKAVMKEKP